MNKEQIYVSDFGGCAYCLLDEALFYTPQFQDGSYSLDENDWIEVDHMAMLGEEEEIRVHLEWVEDKLRRERDGIFADPARMAG